MVIHMIKNNLKFVILVTAVAFSLIRCANSISPPSGGPKDIDPPIILESTPPNGSANFDKDRFTLRFDEYISLANIQQEALISPPMKELPDFKIKGKSLTIKFNEDLLPNTTYSVYFGDAITDITENNPIKNYTYIFSTGKYVDSLSIYGNIQNSFDLQPVEGVYVGLYKDNNDTIEFDSLPYLVPPYYLSKTDENGNFRLTGLSNDSYYIFGINDQNSNFFFDQPVEEIAFLDSLVRPYFIKKPVVDTVISDTIQNIDIEPDSIIATQEILIDSLFNQEIENKSISLFMFLTEDTIQRIEKAEVTEKNKIVFSFSQPAQDVVFELQKYELHDSLFLQEFSSSYDTITWYLNSPPTDSLEIMLTDGLDTLGYSYLKLDPSKKSTRAKKNEEEKKEYLTYKANTTGVLNPDQQLIITFNQPMVTFNDVDSSVLVYNEDTIVNPEFIYYDTILYRSILIPFEPDYGGKYHIYFPDSSFSSWNGIHNQAIDLNLRTLDENEYGTLRMILEPEKEIDYIIQMMDDKQNILFENYFKGDTTITYNYLKPKPVAFKIVYDLNGNKIWDTGNLGEKLQPEKVIFYEKQIEIRANWEIEETWKF
jgi:hypothetical protein